MKLQQKLARIISVIFHPLIIPTLGTLLLMNMGFYFSSLTYAGKIIITVIVMLSTFITPLLSLLLMNMNKQFSMSMEKSTDRVLPLLFTAIFYFIGYFFMGRLAVFPIYRIFIISSILIIVLLMLISTRWKISAHMAGVGGLLGLVVALSIKHGLNHSGIVAVLVVVVGLTGTARLILEKHTLSQVSAGFLIGFTINLFIFNFLG